MSRSGSRAVVLALLATSTIAAPPGPAAPAERESVTLSSGTGLRMTLSPTGSVTSLRLGGREVSGGATPSLFSIRKVGGNPNLLPNPGLEADTDADGVPDGWQLMSGTLRPEWVTDDAHRGSRSVRFQVPSTTTTTTLRTTAPVEPDTYYTLGGWLRSRDVRPVVAPAEPETGASPVRLKVQQLSGSTVVETSQAYGYTGTAPWHRQLVGFRTEPGVTSVRVLAQVVAGSGTVWYDDLSLRRLFRRDWGAGRGTVASSRNKAVFHGTAQHMDIDARIAAHPGYFRINGVASSPKDRRTAFQLRVTLPVDAAGWTWWDDPRRGRRIEPGERYDHLTRWNEQQTSRYPLSTVSGASRALTVGLPLSKPRLARTQYADGRLRVTFDLGVSPETSLLGGARVPFSLVLYPSDADWGYRAAVDTYTQVFPRAFERRTDVAREGGWVGWFDRTRLADTWDDFGLGLHMVALHTGNDGGDTNWGAEFLPWDNERGIYTTAYNHHWGYKHRNLDDPQVPTYETEIDRIRADAAIAPDSSEELRRRDRSVATLNSGARDINGRYLFARYRGFLQHYENLNPLDGALDWRTVSRRHQVEPALAEADRVGATLDALHLDSVSGMRRWGAADDYDTSHWANAANGLTFSYDSGRVVDRLALGVADQVRSVSELAHGRGMFLSANFNGSDARSAAWFGAQAIDYFGLERGLPEKAGPANDPYTTVDGYALFKRVLASQRPISTIDPDCDSYPREELARRFQQTLLYGIYLGCGGASTWRPEQQAVFAEFAPLLREVNAAGWEVVTAARSSDPALLVERFGTLPEDGGVWFAVHNPTDVAREYDVQVEPSATGGLAASAMTAEDRVSGSPVPVHDTADGELGFSGTVAPQSTALVRLTSAQRR